ncbi:hypothetical protein KY290_008105 [Solanum tuberosum]|uniref:Costars domain-containing protein n=1 Tax=Solanum tuberosum TaxID=4113 RepID=A0ABQ7W7L2_SOLTU|nr:hypothetical protein KY290_008105 [Solanum tuberosum]
MNVEEEVERLKEEIKRLGVAQDDGSYKVTFGVLFNDDRCANIFEALVGTLRAAKKRKFLTYDGELLLQGVHDNVEIILKPPLERNYGQSLQQWLMVTPVIGNDSITPSSSTSKVAKQLQLSIETSSSLKENSTASKVQHPDGVDFSGVVNVPTPHVTVVEKGKASPDTRAISLLIIDLCPLQVVDG